MKVSRTLGQAERYIAPQNEPFVNPVPLLEHLINNGVCPRPAHTVAGLEINECKARIR